MILNLTKCFSNKSRFQQKHFRVPDYAIALKRWPEVRDKSDTQTMMGKLSRGTNKDHSNDLKNIRTIEKIVEESAKSQLT